MSLRPVIMFWGVGMLVASCAGGAPPAVESRAPRAPATLAIEVVSGEPMPGSRMEFRARVHKQGLWDAPITVEVKVPPGARLAVGAARAVLQAAGSAEFALELATLPVEDLVVTASSQIEGAGFHAEARYRFGRPQPVKPGPVRSGENVTTRDGVDLGVPVPIKN